MYSIKEKQQNITGQTITTFEREIAGACCFTVEAGTNGYQGGDTGHGSRAFLKIEGDCGADIQVIRTPAGRTSDGGFTIMVGGDSELFNLLTSLKFAVKVIEDQINEVYD